MPETQSYLITETDPFYLDKPKTEKPMIAESKEFRAPEPLPWDIDGFFGEWNDQQPKEQSYDNHNAFTDVAHHFARPFLSQGYNAAAAVNRGMAAFASHLDGIADFIEISTGLKSGGLFEEVAKNYTENAEFWKERAEKVGINFLDEIVSEAIGGAVPGITTFALDVASGLTFPYMDGAAEAYKKGESPFANGVLQAAKTGTLAALFGAIHPLKQYLRMPVMGTVFGLQEMEGAPEGQKTRAFAKGMGIGAGYSLMSPGGTMGLNEVNKAVREAIPEHLKNQRGSIEIDLEKQKPAEKWFSPMAQVLDQKLPGKGTPESFKSTIEAFSKKGDFAKEELEWSGVLDWLKEQKGKVTKQDVLDYMAENNVQLQEVEKSSAVPELEWKDAVKGGKYTVSTDNRFKIEHLPNGKFLLNSPGGMGDLQYSLQDAKDSAERYNQNIGTRDTKFSQYVLPGGENYRELLLTLPAKKRIPSLNAYIKHHYGAGGESWLKETNPEKYKEAVQFYEEEKADTIESGRGFAKGVYDADGIPTEAYTSSHWQEPNVLSHVRFDERTGPNGEKILHIAEIQSDWHQEGRKKGYQRTKDNTLIKETEIEGMKRWALFDKESGERLRYRFKRSSKLKRDLTKDEAHDDLLKTHNQLKAVPNAPFKKTQAWSMLAMKRMVRYATENGFDAVSWDTGETQADRYDLSKQVDSIRITKRTKGWTFDAKKKGSNLIFKEGLTDSELADNVGKDLAEKAMADLGSQDSVNIPTKVYSGLDLKVGGEGMKGFYDKILPSEVNKFFNKKAWGNAKVGKTEIETKPATGPVNIGENLEPLPTQITKAPETKKAWSLPITPEMKSKALSEGMPLFGSHRPISAVLKDINAVIGERGELGGKELTPEQKAAAERLKTDISKIIESAKAKGLSIVEYLESIGYHNDKVIGYIVQKSKELEKEKKEKPQGTRQRKFLETIEESATTDPSVAEGVSEIEPQDYIVQPNSESLLMAQDRMATEGIDRTVDYVLSDAELNAEKGATFITLMDRFQKQGDFDRAIQMVEAFDTQLREAGRFVQAASIWNKLTPPGFIRWAEKQLLNSKKKYGWLDTIFKNKPESFELSKEEKKMVFERMAEINKMPEGIDKTDATLELVDMIAKKVPPSVSELFDAYRYQNMLSGLRTQLRNIGENMGNTFMTRPIDIVTRGAVDFVKSSLTGKEREAYVNDVPVYLKTAINAVPNAVNAFVQVMKAEAGVELGKPDIGVDVKSEFERARFKQLPAYLTLVSRFMEASDKFNSAIIGAGEFAVQKKNGATDAEAYAAGVKLSEKYLYRDKLDPKDPDLGIFSKVLASTGKLMEQSRKLPGLGTLSKWFVPFIRTPINKGIQMIERSPLGLARGKFDQEAVARLVGGGMVTAVGAMFALDNKTTWSPPTDPEEKALFYAAGMKPYSVRIGDKWIPVWYLGPFALAFALPAAAKYHAMDSKKALTNDKMEKLIEIAAATAKFVGSQTSTQSIGALFSALDGDIDYNISSTTAFTVQQVIPATGFVRWVNTIIDPVYRKPKGFMEQIYKNLPVLSQNLEARMTPTLEESRREPVNYFLPYDLGTSDPFYEGMLPFVRGQARQKHLENEMKKIVDGIQSGDLSPEESMKDVQKLMEASPKSMEKMGKELMQVK